MSTAEKLTTLAENIPKVFNTGYRAGMNDFIANKDIGDYYNDSITYLNMYAFAGRTSISSIALPNVIGSNVAVFSYCSNLVRVSLPKYNDIAYHSIFMYCRKLELVDFGMVTRIESSVFSSCTVLKTIILRNKTVTELYGVSVFSGTPYASGGTGGKIYVPSNLIEEYKSATNWSALYGYGTVEFVALEGSEYE